MNRSLKEALSLTLFLIAISVQLCQAYPEPSAPKNEEIAEEFATDVQTLSQIEEENTDQISEGDLKRPSRKVPCPFHKLKSGITKAAAIPCGAAAGAAAAALAGSSIGGSIGGSSAGEATLRGGSLEGVSIGGADVTGIGGGVSFNHLTNGIDIISERAVEIGASLQGAISSLQELLIQMPLVLAHLRTEAETKNVPVGLRYDLVQTCDGYAQAEKSISGVINHIYNSLKLPSFKGGHVHVKNNIEIGSCLDNIKTNMMSFLATIRSWFSCDKSFLSNKGISKFQSYIQSIPSGSQCSILNRLGKSSSNYVLVPHASGYYAVDGSGAFSASGSSQVNAALIEQQLGEAKQILAALESFPGTMTALVDGIRDSLLNQVNQMTYAANAAQTAQAQTQVRTIQVPVAPVYQMPTYTHTFRSGNVMPLIPSISGQSFVNINQRVSDIPAAKTTFHITSAQQAPAPAPLICSGQNLIDNIYNSVSTSPGIKHTDSHHMSSTVGITNSGRSALDLLSVRVILSRDTVYALLQGQIPAAGDIIILNLTDDIMIVGSPSDDISPITFNFIYRGITSRTRYNNNILVWNVSENDFTCNQDIFNDVLGHLVYGL